MPSKDQWSNAATLLAALFCVFVGFLLGDVVSGFVTFAARTDGRLFLYGRLEGIDGLHGVHIHDYGNLDDGCRATGSHFNPSNAEHGFPGSAVKHAGDLGNLKFINRSAILKSETSSFALWGPLSVVGRSLVIHQRRDDLGLGGHVASLVNGASGEKLACCVIAIDRQHSAP